MRMRTRLTLGLRVGLSKSGSVVRVRVESESECKDEATDVGESDGKVVMVRARPRFSARVTARDVTGVEFKEQSKIRKGSKLCNLYRY